MIEFLTANMAPIMFASLIIFLLFGYSVAFSLAACNPTGASNVSGGNVSGGNALAPLVSSGNGN